MTVSGPIIKHPVFLSLKISFRNLLSLLLVKSSKYFATVNLVKGLYSIAVKSKFLNNFINSLINSSLILILIILFEELFCEIIKPEILVI